MSKHPTQPVEYDENGVIRFKKNAIVRWMLDQGGLGRKFDMNEISIQEFSIEDRVQFAQLIGYSVSGFGDLSYVSKKVCRKCDKLAQKLIDDEAP